MKKGFTLVELLATIVILAIVSLITIPVITGVINKTRLNSLKSSAYGLLEASNLYIAQYNPDNTIRFDIDNNNITSNDTINLLKYKGIVKEGTVILNKNGKVTVCITDGKNSAYKNYNETKVTLVEKNKCYIPNNTSIVYIDNGATITELSNQELTDRLTEALDRISDLENKVKKTTTKEEIYPVGSVYISFNNTNPSTLFGGTWEQIESGKMLQSTTTNSGVEGGQASVLYTPSGTVNPHILTVAEMPSHSHNLYMGIDVNNSHPALPDNGTRTWYNVSVPGLLLGSTAAAGSSQPHQHAFTGTQTSIATMPPYITVYMWKRVS